MITPFIVGSEVEVFRVGSSVDNIISLSGLDVGANT